MAFFPLLYICLLCSENWYKFIEIPKGKIEKLKDMIDELIKVLSQGKRNGESVQRSKRSTNLSGNFTHSNSSSRITMLENEIKKVKKSIESIKELKDSPAISNEDRVRLSTLETNLENLQKKLDGEIKSLREEIQVVTADTGNLTSTVNQIAGELEEMKHEAKEKEIAEKKKLLPNECIKDIEARRFEAADQKLQQINDDNEINRIVKKVYNHQAGSFDLLLKFGNSVRNIRRSFFVYKALNYEMESNGHKDPFKMIQLVESVRKEIIDQQNTSSEIKGEAESLISTLKISIKSLAKEKLKDGMLSDHYASTTELADKIHSFNNELFKDIIKEVVNDVYGRVDTEKILGHIRSHSYIEQLISGYIAVFDKMKANDDLNNSTIFKLAYYIKETMKMDNYPNVLSEKRTELESVKGRLPKSVENSVFSSKVCIKNVAYNEYLYAAGFAQHDKDRRRVFTWIPGTVVIQAGWKIEPEGDHFLIKNVQYSEYLFAASDGYRHDDERRSVFTWVPGGAVIQGRWQIEPDGNNVHIRNTERSEYLFADADRKYDSDRRYVFTWIPGGKPWDSLWSIEDCSYGHRKRDIKAIEVQNNVGNATIHEEEMEKDMKPSSYVNDITLESIKTKNSSFIGR